jgi:hypothetical protein
MNFVLGLPEGSRNKNSIMVVVDRFSKVTHLFPCRKTLDATIIFDLYFKEIIRLHGIPKIITSYQDSKFINHFWLNFREKLVLIFNSTLLVIHE